MSSNNPLPPPTTGPHQEYPPLGGISAATSPPDRGIVPLNSGHKRQSMSGGGGGGRNQQRFSGDYSRANGSRAIPTGPHSHLPNGGGPRVAGPFNSNGTFEGPRSPNTRNTSHVPCKFYKLGQCQAGKMCPFSHAEESNFGSICKYFQKGNCKFGQKCALVHMLPNGVIVNKGHTGRVNLNIGGRIDPMAHQAHQNQESALGNSLSTQQGSQPFNHQIPPMPGMESTWPSVNPSIATPYDVPRPNTQYGTPREEAHPPTSPITHLTTLEVPLPASFDSNAQAFMTRPGPHAASVPARSTLDSSSPLSVPKNGYPSEVLRNLHESAYSPSAMALHFGSSPSGPAAVEGFGGRMMHSRRVNKTKALSASLPPFDPKFEPQSEDDDEFYGEEYVPGNLAHLLSEREKSRRLSGKTDNPKSVRDSISGTPVDYPIKAGSPTTNSPSRFTALFNRQKQEEHNGYLSSSFGHVGSPLRNSSLHLGSSPSMRSGPRTPGNEAGPFFLGSSPQPRMTSTSALSQQLRSTHLRGSNKTGENGNELLPGPTRYASNPRSGFDRAVSSSSAGVSRIEEELPDIFSLDEETPSSTKPNNNNPWSANTKVSLGSIGSERFMASLRQGNDGKEAVTNGIKIPKRSSRLGNDSV